LTFSEVIKSGLSALTKLKLPPLSFEITKSEELSALILIFPTDPVFSIATCPFSTLIVPATLPKT